MDHNVLLTSTMLDTVLAWLNCGVAYSVGNPDNCSIEIEGHEYSTKLNPSSFATSLTEVDLPEPGCPAKNSGATSLLVNLPLILFRNICISMLFMLFPIHN